MDGHFASWSTITTRETRLLWGDEDILGQEKIPSPGLEHRREDSYLWLAHITMEEFPSLSSVVLKTAYQTCKLRACSHGMTKAEVYYTSNSHLVTRLITT
jgi:hypothetical protein